MTEFEDQLAERLVDPEWVLKWNRGPNAFLSVGALIERLRAEEGDSVTINCSNPDFEGPAEAVDCNGAWTAWKDKRFTGSNLLEALTAAYAERLGRPK